MFEDSEPWTQQPFESALAAAVRDGEINAVSTAVSLVAAGALAAALSNPRWARGVLRKMQYPADANSGSEFIDQLPREWQIVSATRRWGRFPAGGQRND